MKKFYSIAIGPGGSEELADHVFGYDKTHELEFEASGDSVKAVFDKQHQKSSLMERIHKFVQTYIADKTHNDEIESKEDKEKKKRELVTELVDIPSGCGYSASVPEHLWFNLCSDVMMVSECMALAPELGFSFVYMLEPLGKGPQWSKNYKLVIGEQDLGNDFKLEVKHTNQEGKEILDTRKITLTEVIDLEKIPEDSVRQRQEAPTGTD